MCESGCTVGSAKPDLAAERLELCPGKYGLPTACQISAQSPSSQETREYVGLWGEKDKEPGKGEE